MIECSWDSASQSIIIPEIEVNDEGKVSNGAVELDDAHEDNDQKTT